ncbi:hypothetical protein NXC12_PD00200 (plasmid) [Rhizobium etli]|uniref:Uncharacterized protein n=1 Tax=Rhizobium etli TaxID=29449 RepID=A0AAN1BLC4_RHIET|nr:hypothetical protein NXC12_PD00200 [Rhizobium etli]
MTSFRNAASSLPASASFTAPRAFYSDHSKPFKTYESGPERAKYTRANKRSVMAIASQAEAEFMPRSIAGFA